MATTEVILTEKIAHLGAEADVVKVKVGFARNYLIPQRKAVEITPATLKRINQLKAKRAEREARELNEAEDLARRINKLKITMELETGESGKAFGSITTTDLAGRITKELGSKAELDRHKIQLDKPIKETGPHEIAVRLHPDVTAKFSLTVKAKGAETAAAEGAPEEKSEGFKAKPKAKHAR